MKIGLVFDDSLDQPDGVQQYILSLGAWLIANGHEVAYLVGETKRRDITHMHSLGRNVQVKFNGNRVGIPLPASKAAIRQVLAAENFDVLHVQMPYSPWLAGRILQAAPLRTAIIGTFHIAPYSKLVELASRLLAVWSRRTLRRFDAVVSVSRAAQSFARQAFGIDSEIVPNTFDYERFHRAIPLPSQDDRPTILFLGRLVERKGCQTLLAAAARLRDQKLDFSILICGGGPLESSLKAYVRAQGLDDIVTFVGRVSEVDKPRYYASADIAVFPSSGGESFGIVLLEAMASGRAAVLAGDNSGYSSVLFERPQSLFNPTDDAALAKKLAELLRNDDRRQKAAAWGMKNARQYDTAIVGNQLVTIYQHAFAKYSRNES